MAVLLCCMPAHRSCFPTFLIAAGSFSAVLETLARSNIRKAGGNASSDLFSRQRVTVLRGSRSRGCEWPRAIRVALPPQTRKDRIVATKFSSRRHRRLGFQPLEERTMMAGDAGANILGGKVGVIVIAGDLYVTGDAAANNVAIAQVMQNGVPVNGNYVINGLNGTTINGGTGYRATGVTRDFIIDMGGGGDSLLLGPDPNFSTPTSNNKLNVPRDLHVWMGNSGTAASYFGSNTFYANGITVGHDADIR